MQLSPTLSTTQSIWQKDKDHFLHPYTNLKDFPNEGSVVYARGDRHFVYDNDGKKYIDGIAGLWCVNIGHGRQRINLCTDRHIARERHATVSRNQRREMPRARAGVF